MKDAVVLFNGGCTGELISPEGLLLTNHHCGYDAIQKHSTVEHDYLTNGFWAMSRAEELPNEKLWVRFLVRMEEVTDRIAAGETAAQIVEKAKAEGTGYKASVEQMYYGNQQFLFVYEQFDDVRLVAAPPSSIGKFGGDTDNWIWPRHTGDFSMFRVYASKDNRPAAYSPQNVPYRPKKHFSISTKGVKEGDFTMIYGFPGNTQEYILSDAVAYIAERSDPAKIAIRTGRLDIITKAQESDPALRIHYAAKHASIANAWKKWQGEALGIDRRGTVAAKFDYETQFGLWSVGRPEYAGVVMGLRAEYDRIMDAYFAYEITRETLSTLPAAYTPRRTGRRVLRPAQVRRAGALAPCVPRIRPLPEGLPHALLRRRHGPLQIAGSLRRRPFRGRMGRLRQRGHATRSQTARGDQTHARPYLVDAGNQVAAQPQQQNPQRTLYYLYKGVCANGTASGPSIPTPT